MTLQSKPRPQGAAVFARTLANVSISEDVTPDGTAVEIESLREELLAADSAHGLRHTAPLTMLSVHCYDGSRDSPPLDLQTWRQIYADIGWGPEGAVCAPGLPSLDSLHERTVALSRDHKVPLIMADVRHTCVSRQAAEAVLNNAASIDRIERGVGVQETRTFLATALLPHRWRKLELLEPAHIRTAVSFVYEPWMWLSNHGQPPRELHIDFSDGRGPRLVNPGDEIAIQYPGAGEYTIAVEAVFADCTLHGAFEFKIVLPRLTRPVPDYQENLQADRTFKDNAGPAKGTFAIYYGSTDGVKHSALQRPLLVADGFPTGGGSVDNHLDEMYALLSESDFLQQVLDYGYDVVLLTYDDGTDYIESNAYLAAKCIQRLIELRQGTEQLCVCGGSMGGIITRYALLFLEEQRFDHQTRLYLSFDSPHLGAYLPWSALTLVWIFARKYHSQDAVELLKLIQSKAGNEFAITTIDDVGSIGTTQEHVEFVQTLYTKGMPKHVAKRIAVANGRGDGKSLFEPGARLFEARKGSILMCLAQALPETTHVKNDFVYAYSFIPQPFGDGKKYTATIEQGIVCHAWDCAPGGMRRTAGQIADELDKKKLHVVRDHDLGCFIPTISALNAGVPTSDPFAMLDPWQEIPPHGLRNGFHAYMASTTDTEHVQITEEIAAYLLWELELIAASNTLAAATVNTGAQILYVDHIYAIDGMGELLDWTCVADGSDPVWSLQRSAVKNGEPSIALAAASGGGNAMNIFSASRSGALLHTCNASAAKGRAMQWLPFENLSLADPSLKLTGPIAAMSGSHDGLSVFTTSSQSSVAELYQKYWSVPAQRWFPWRVVKLGLDDATPIGPLAVGAGGDADQLLLALVCQDGTVRVALLRESTGTLTTPMISLGAGLNANDPIQALSTAAVGHPFNTFNVFALTRSGRLEWCSSPMTSTPRWSAWQDLSTTRVGGGLSASAIAFAATVGSDYTRIRVYNIARDGQIICRQASDWGSQWANDWEPVMPTGTPASEISRALTFAR